MDGDIPTYFFDGITSGDLPTILGVKPEFSVLLESMMILDLMPIYYRSVL
jgi:hypothetical protein